MLLSDTMKVKDKLQILEEEYHIPVNDELRKDVNVMCNLGEGIEERAIERTTKKVTKEFILSMYENHFTLEQIAKVAHKSIEEVRSTIEKETVSV